MPYIGNTAADRFVASKAASVYSGDGSTTAFTLEHSVGADEDILVSVDGVVQEPSVAYAVSSGTTLTFTAAPSSNSGNNIFVYYLFRTVATVDHPSTSALSATSGTFSTDLTVDTTTLVVDSTNNRVGVGIASPSQALHVAGGNPAAIIESTTSTGSFVQFKNTSSSNTNRLGYAVHDFVVDTNGNEALRIDASGQITKSLQPSFLVQPSTAQNNIGEGSQIVVAFGTERFDVGSNFASNTFTAPVTGKYLLNFALFVVDIDNAPSYFETYLVTSNRNYYNTIDPRGFDQDPTYWTFTNCVVADMDANDTSSIQFNIHNGGTVQSDIQTYSHFSGYLLG